MPLVSSGTDAIVCKVHNFYLYSSRRLLHRYDVGLPLLLFIATAFLLTISHHGPLFDGTKNISDASKHLTLYSRGRVITTAGSTYGESSEQQPYIAISTNYEAYWTAEEGCIVENPLPSFSSFMRPPRTCPIIPPSTMSLSSKLTISLVITGILLVLLHLTTHWSVQARCLFALCPVGYQEGAKSASHVLVMPLKKKADKNYDQMICEVERTPGDAGFFIVYYNQRFVFNERLLRFEGLSFPSKMTIDFYMTSRGLCSDANGVFHGVAGCGKGVPLLSPSAASFAETKVSALANHMKPEECQDDGAAAKVSHPSKPDTQALVGKNGRKYGTLNVVKADGKSMNIGQGRYSPRDAESDFLKPQRGKNSTGRNGEGLSSSSTTVSASIDTLGIGTKFPMNDCHIPSLSFGALFLEHATSPFFVFQVFSSLLLMLDDYWYISMMTLSILVLTEVQVVMKRLKDLKDIKMMKSKLEPVFALRNDVWRKVDAKEVLPGDILAIEGAKHGGTVTCPVDGVILKGSAVVNEAILTGESMVLMKVQLERDLKVTRPHPENSPSDSLEKCVSDNDTLAVSDINPDEEARKTAYLPGNSSEEGNSVLDIEGTHRSNVLFAGTQILLAQSSIAAESSEDGEDDFSKSANTLLTSSSLTSSASPTADSEENLSKNRIRKSRQLQQKQKVHRYPQLPSSNYVVIYTLKTGFYTAQGKMLRTILSFCDRITVNSKEALYFLLLLLLVALSASSYVLYCGLQADGVHIFKLLLYCLQILTSVVPIEFPITLTLVVSVAMVGLFKKGTRCTEPFRMVTAGQVNILAFDKTGTLTSDKMLVQGVYVTPEMLVTNQRSSAGSVSPLHRILYADKPGLVEGHTQFCEENKVRTRNHPRSEAESNFLQESQGEFAMKSASEKPLVRTSANQGKPNSETASLIAAELPSSQRLMGEDKAALPVMAEETASSHHGGKRYSRWSLDLFLSSLCGETLGFLRSFSTCSDARHLESSSTKKCDARKTMDVAAEVGSSLLNTVDDAHTVEKTLTDQIVPFPAIAVMGGCNSLCLIKGKVVGDPMELAAFEAVGWRCVSNDKMVNSRMGIPAGNVFPPLSSMGNVRETVEGLGTMMPTSFQGGLMIEKAAKRQSSPAENVSSSSVLMRSGASSKSTDFSAAQVAENMESRSRFRDFQSRVNEEHLRVMKRFPFSSALQRMTVIAEHKGPALRYVGDNLISACCSDPMCVNELLQRNNFDDYLSRDVERKGAEVDDRIIGTAAEKEAPVLLDGIKKDGVDGGLESHFNEAQGQQKHSFIKADIRESEKTHNKSQVSAPSVSTVAESGLQHLVGSSSVASSPMQLGISASSHPLELSSLLQKSFMVKGSTPFSAPPSYLVLSKGSPERMKKFISHPPSEYDELCTSFTMKGYRVLSLGYKLTSADAVHMRRSDVEANLNFAGFLVFSCKLKPGTKDIIAGLRASNLKTIMITGDNPLTACQVAKELEMVTKPEGLILTVSPSNRQQVVLKPSQPMHSLRRKPLLTEPAGGGGVNHSAEADGLPIAVKANEDMKSEGSTIPQQSTVEDSFALEASTVYSISKPDLPPNNKEETSSTKHIYSFEEAASSARLVWRSVRTDEIVKEGFDFDNLVALKRKYFLCLAGDALDLLQKQFQSRSDQHWNKQSNIQSDIPAFKNLSNGKSSIFTNTLVGFIFNSLVGFSRSSAKKKDADIRKLYIEGRSSDCHSDWEASSTDINGSSQAKSGDKLAAPIRISNPDKRISLKDILCYFEVFTRASPRQKQLIIQSLNSAGNYTMMCGDGTNDAGALKAAHVGVSLLSSSGGPADENESSSSLGVRGVFREVSALGSGGVAPQDLNHLRSLTGLASQKIQQKTSRVDSGALEKQAGRAMRQTSKYGKNLPFSSSSHGSSKAYPPFARRNDTFQADGAASSSLSSVYHRRKNQDTLWRYSMGSKGDAGGSSVLEAAVKPTPIVKVSKANALAEALKEASQDMEFDNVMPALGEASIASPFTHRGTTIRCVLPIVLFGRATMATVISMYQLMGVNSLVTAFAFSVLRLAGVKFGDLQGVVEGLFITLLTLIQPSCKPSSRLTHELPASSIFAPSAFAILLGQIVIHLIVLMVGWRLAEVVKLLKKARLLLPTIRAEGATASSIYHLSSSSSLLSPSFSVTSSSSALHTWWNFPSFFRSINWAEWLYPLRVLPLVIQGVSHVPFNHTQLGNANGFSGGVFLAAQQLQDYPKSPQNIVGTASSLSFSLLNNHTRLIDADEFVERMDGKFYPNAINTIIFFILSGMHIGSYLCNFGGTPWVMPLSEAPLMKWALVAAFSWLALIVFEVSTAFNRWLGLIVGLGWEVQLILACLILFDVGGSWLWVEFIKRWKSRSFYGKLRNEVSVGKEDECV